jgi:hypothetical protein
MYELDLKTVHVLREAAILQGLLLCWQYKQLTDEQSQLIMNGIGPDKWSDVLHRIADELLSWFVVDSTEHDVRYEYGLGTVGDWHSANDEFLANCRRTIDHHHLNGLIDDILKVTLHEVAILLYDAVETDQGYTSYMAAFKRGPAVPLAALSTPDASK